MKYALTTLALFCSAYLFSQFSIEQIRGSMQAYRDGDFQSSCLYLDTLSSDITWFNQSLNVRVHRAIEVGDTQAIRFFDYYASHPEFKTSDWVKPIQLYISLSNAKPDCKEAAAVQYVEFLENQVKKDLYGHYDALYSLAVYSYAEEHELLTTGARRKLLQLGSAAISNDVKGTSLEKYIDLYAGYHLTPNNTAAKDVSYTPRDQRNLRFYLLTDDEVQLLPTFGQILSDLAAKESASGTPSTYYRWMSLTVNSSEESLQLFQSAFNNEDALRDSANANMQRYWEPLWDTSIIRIRTEIHDAKKQWVLVDFWGTWCSPCVEELPNYQILQEEINAGKHPNLAIFTISYGSKDLQNFLQSNHYTFDVIEMLPEQKMALGINSFPSTFIVSPSGHILKLPLMTDKTGAAIIWSRLF